MTDYFALLGVPRQPRLDLVALEDSFHQLARNCHPDRCGPLADQSFAELNRAFAILANPASRLQHLVALEGHEERNASTEEYNELFIEAAAIAHKAAESVRTTKGAQTALGRSVADLKSAQVSAELTAIIEKLHAEYARALSKLDELDKLWHLKRATALAEAVVLYQRFSFLQRWEEKLEDVLFQIQH